MNPYPSVSGDTSGLDISKAASRITGVGKALVTIAMTPKGAAIIGGCTLTGALIGGKKHRVLGGALGIGAFAGLLYFGNPTGNI